MGAKFDALGGKKFLPFPHRSIVSLLSTSLSIEHFSELSKKIANLHFCFSTSRVLICRQAVNWWQYQININFYYCMTMGKVVHSTTNEYFGFPRFPSKKSVEQTLFCFEIFVIFFYCARGVEG